MVTGGYRTYSNSAVEIKQYSYKKQMIFKTLYSYLMFNETLVK